MDLAILAAVANLGSQLAAAQEIVHRFCDVVVYGHALPVLDLYEHVKGWGCLALEHGLLRAAASGFLVAERHAIDAAHQVAERGVEQEVFKRDAVGRADQLHPALGDRACCGGLKLAADFVDDDDLRHVVFHGLDHHLVLLRWLGHLHAPGAANGRMRDIAVAADLVGCVDDDRALGVAQHTGCFAQQSGLADTWPAQEQDALARLDRVEQDIDHAVDRSSDAQGQADDAALPVANTRNAVQCSLDACPVVAGELADAPDHIVEIGLADLSVAQRKFAVGITCLRQPAQIHNHLEQCVCPIGFMERVLDSRWQDVKEYVQIVGDFLLGQDRIYLNDNYPGRSTAIAETVAGSAALTRTARCFTSRERRV